MAGDLDISTFIPFNLPEHYHNLTGMNKNSKKIVEYGECLI